MVLYVILYYGLVEWYEISRIFLRRHADSELAYVEQFCNAPVTDVLVHLIPTIILVANNLDMLSHVAVIVVGSYMCTLVGLGLMRIRQFVAYKTAEGIESDKDRVHKAVELTVYFWVFEVFYVTSVVIPMCHGPMLYMFSDGPGLLLVWFVGAWQTDNGALFFGKLCGRTKCAPFISPGKTWEGVLGGFIFAWVSLLLLSPLSNWWIVPDLTAAQMCILSPLISTVSILGDMAESFIKRAAGVKDSGTFFPGHGGMLDRIDSIALSAPIVFYFFYLARL
jgi:phosphatidate cytidylyltransferase